MKNKRLIVLVGIFILVLSVFLVKVFILDKEDVIKQNSVIKEVIDEDEVEFELIEDEKSVFGFIDDVDLSESYLRDPFGSPSSVEEEFIDRENSFINKINLMVSAMELEKLKATSATGEETEGDNSVPLNDNEVDITPIIEKFSSKYSIEKELIAAIIQHESSFEINAQSKNVNGTVDRGLMQLNSDTAPWLAKEIGLEYKEGIEFDPEVNIEMGAFYLRHLTDILNDQDFIITAYNKGPKGAYDYKLTNGNYSSEYSKTVRSLITK